MKGLCPKGQGSKTRPVSMRFSALFELSNTAGTFDASEIELLSAPLKSPSASSPSWRRRPSSSCRWAIRSRFLP